MSYQSRHHRGGAPNWFHDSKSVMTGIKRGDGSVAFYRIDLKTGFQELPTHRRAAFSR